MGPEQPGEWVKVKHETHAVRNRHGDVLRGSRWLRQHDCGAVREEKRSCELQRTRRDQSGGPPPCAAVTAEYNVFCLCIAFGLLRVGARPSRSVRCRSWRGASARMRMTR